MHGKRGRMSKTFKKGDKVTWETSQGETTGKVTGKITDEAHIKGHTVKASKDEPQYRVKSDKTGAEAAHKADALEKA